MSVADTSGHVHESTSIDTWRTVLNAVIDNVQSCVLEGNGAGGMHLANRTSSCPFSSIDVFLLKKLMPAVVDDEYAKVVYIYAVGSPFESVLNKYMSGYTQGVNPDNPISFLAATAPRNSSTRSDRSRPSSSRLA